MRPLGFDAPADEAGLLRVAFWRVEGLALSKPCRRRAETSAAIRCGGSGFLTNAFGL